MRLIYALFILALMVCSGCAPSHVAGRDYTRASEINARKGRAHTLIEGGHYQEAIDLLTPLREHQVKDSQLYSMLGEALWKVGAYDQAVSNFESSIRLNYSDSHTHLTFGEMLMEMGKVGRALTEFELAVSFDEKEPLAHYNYGLALYEFGRKDEALSQWGMARRLDVRDARYAEALGIGHGGTDDVKALEYFEEALQLGANTPVFHNNFGLLLTRLQEYARARTHFETAVGADPHDPRYRFNLAVAALKAKDFRAAIPLLEVLHRDSPDDGTYRIYLARACYEERRFAETIELLEGWLQTPGAVGNPTAGGHKSAGAPVAGLNDAYDVLAMSFRGIGQLDKATVYIGKALEIQPASPIHLNNYGVILAENGRIEEAKAQWQKVLRIEPDNAVAKQNLSAFGK